MRRDGPASQEKRRMDDMARKTSSIPKHSAQQALAIFTRFAELPDGVYTVHTEFPNPFHDRRNNYGFECRPACTKGMQFRIAKSERTIQLSDPTRDDPGLSVTFTDHVVRYGSRTVVSGHDGMFLANYRKDHKPSLGDHKAIHFLALLAENTKAEEPSLGSVLSTENGVYSGPPVEAILALLVEAGKADLDDVREAINTWEEFSQEEGDALYEKHSLNA